MDAIWVFVPILGAFAAHAPVLRWDLLRGLRRPLDGGLTFRGRRLLGDNKTWRGALTMATGVIVATLLLSYWRPWWSQLPGPIQAVGPLAFGGLVALGTVLGELPNSFLKRQLDIEPGSDRFSLLGVALSLYDQADFVPGIWLALLPVWRMPMGDAAVAFVVVAAVHLVVNFIGWGIGARKVPI